MIDDESGEWIRPRPQYMDDLIVHHPELGKCELWKCIAWETSKLRNAVARADSASSIDEQADPKKNPPPLVADAIQKAETDLMLRVNDALKALDRRMTKLECAADERKRAQAADAALALAEDIAENAPQALLSSLADRIDRRLH